MTRIGWLALGLAMSVPGVASAQIAPSAQWAIDYGDRQCTLSRRYDSPAGPMLLSFQPEPFGDKTAVALATPMGNSTTKHEGKATITLSPQNQKIASDLTTMPLPPIKQQMNSMTMSNADMASLASTTGIAFAIDKEAPVTLAFANGKAALAALKACNDDLAKRWGIDPHEADAIAQPARPADSVEWVVQDDYPSSSRVKKEKGTSTIVWMIGTDGKASDCRTVATSGSPALDEAACGAILKRARYHPAIGKDGQPIAVHAWRHVLWIPRK